MKKALIAIGVVLALALIVWASMRDTGPRGTEVEIQAAEARTVSSRVKATGEITPEKRVAISAKVVGEIINLPVTEGQEVEAGPGPSLFDYADQLGIRVPTSGHKQARATLCG